MTGNVYVAPVGIALDGEWANVGHADPADLLWGIDPSADDDVTGRLAPIAVSFTAPLLDTGSRWFDLLTGRDAEPEPVTHQLLITYKAPFRDVPPTKRRGLTGKKYRQARRAFARSRRAWVRAGRPRIDTQVHIPRARIETRP